METQTREDNYAARSKKLTLLKILHCMDTCSYSCLTRLTKEACYFVQALLGDGAGVSLTL